MKTIFNIKRNYVPYPERGFTLIELLVVISIIGLLASVILASLNGARTRAQNTAKVQEVGQIVNALELYYGANGHYPPRGDMSGTIPSMKCIGYNENEKCFGPYGDSGLFAGNDSFNAKLSEYIPGPPRNDYPVVDANGNNYKGIVYGCVEGPSDCKEYELWWYLKDTNTCPKGEPELAGSNVRCFLNSTNKY